MSSSRESFGSHGGDHFLDDPVDVFAPAIHALAKVERDLVGAEEGRDDAERERGGEASHDAQCLELVVQGEPVPRLDLHRRDAGGSEAHEARRGEREELVLTARAQIAHGGVDAPAPSRDLQVVDAGRAQLLLLAPCTAEDRMGVRVDEARREHATGAVDDRGVGVRRTQLRGGSDRGDETIANEEGAVRHDAGVAQLDADARPRRAGAGDDLPRADEEERARHASGRAWPITSRTRERRSGAWASPRQA